VTNRFRLLERVSPGGGSASPSGSLRGHCAGSGRGRRGRTQKSVLNEFDPPLNLQDVPKNDLQRELSRLRAVYTSRRPMPPVDVGGHG
jgi:hypothetical protein